MPTIGKDVLALLLLLLLVIGTGGYLTYVQQPAEVERLEKAEKLERMKRTELTSLVAEHAASKREAKETISKWRSRYKVIPDSLSSAEIMGAINDLTRSGFENFDVSVGSIERTPDYSYYTVRATGRGYFSSLYRFIWQIENGRRFYNIRDLQLDHIDLETEDKETGRRRLQVMVSFNMKLDAYFGGPESASAGRGAKGRAAWNGETPPVPKSVLADERPDVNPFFPVIMEQLPPNTHDLLDVENAEFVSIVDGQAIFRDEQGYRKVGVGDGVYLGQITSVDPLRGRVTARLNKGGILDRVELSLQDAEENYRQAIGPASLDAAEFDEPAEDGTAPERTGEGAEAPLGPPSSGDAPLNR